MSTLTAPRTLEFVGAQDEISPKLAASDTYYKGMLLCTISGYAADPTDTAALFIAGIVTGDFEGGVRDDAYVVAAATYPRARLLRGKVWLPFSGAAQTDVGLVFYVADSGTLTKTAGSKTVGLVALDFKAGYLLFDLRQYDRIA